MVAQVPQRGRTEASAECSTSSATDGSLVMAHAARSRAGRRCATQVAKSASAVTVVMTSPQRPRAVVKPMAATVSQIGPTMPAMYCSGLMANSVARPPRTRLVTPSQRGSAR